MQPVTFVGAAGHVRRNAHEDASTQSLVSFGSPILYVNQTFLYDKRKHTNGIHYSTISDLKNMSIGALHSSGVMKFLLKTEGPRLVSNTTHEGLARQLHTGRIDLWATVELTGSHFLKKLYGDQAANYGWTRSFQKGDVSLVCSRKLDPDEKLTRQFAEGLARIKKDGTYLRIMGEYYSGLRNINPEALPSDVKPPT